MKKFSLLLPIAAMIFVGCSTVKKVEVQVPPPPPVNILTNDVDSMSYALGVNVGNDFAKNIKSIPGGKSKPLHPGLCRCCRALERPLKRASAWLTAWD